MDRSQIMSLVERDEPDDLVEYASQIGGRRLAFRLKALSPESEKLLWLRLNAFLRPRGQALIAHIESQLRVPVPKYVTIAISGVTVMPEVGLWHWFLNENDTTGRQVLEMVLVQIVAQTPQQTDDYGGWHRVACSAIKAVVDPNFICILDIRCGKC